MRGLCGVALLGALLLAEGGGLGCEAESRPRPRPARPEPEAKPAPEPAARPEPELPPEPTDPSIEDTPSKSVEALSPTERRAHLNAVAEGRRLHRDGDYLAAFHAFARALKVAPGDPRTLSEQGWAALFAGRLDEAQRALEEAERGARGQRRLHASILYNLGRVAEAQSRPKDALLAYQESLRLRPHPAAYRHLMGLPDGTRYVFGPSIQRLQGPYDSVASFCAQERRMLGEEDEAAFGCVPDAAKGIGGKAVQVPGRGRVSAPWKALRFIETRPDPYAVRFHAALRTAEGWWVLPDVASLARDLPETQERATRLSAAIEELVGGGDAEVVLEIETRWSEEEAGVEQGAEIDRVEFLCGLGASGVVRCTGALPRASESQRSTSEGMDTTRWTVERRIDAEGRLVLSGDAKVLNEPTAALLGTHPLVFE
ncbi:MAG: tetratricopeptide repeat protein [Myxococcota bacterium]